MSEAPYGTAGGPTLPGYGDYGGPTLPGLATSQVVTCAIPQGMMPGPEGRFVPDPDAIAPPVRATAPVRVIVQCAGCGHELFRDEGSREAMTYIEYEISEHNGHICPVCDAAAVLDQERYLMEWRAKWQREHPGEEMVVIA